MLNGMCTCRRSRIAETPKGDPNDGWSVQENTNHRANNLEDLSQPIITSKLRKRKYSPFGTN